MNKSWSNTMLVAYSLLPKIVHDLNFGVKTRINSSFQSKHFKMGVSTEQLISEILELTEEKRKLVNLRYLVREAMDSLTPVARKMLAARIIGKKTYQSLAAEYGVSLRTAFRRVENAEASYALALKRQGYTDEWFEKEYGGDKYIKPIRQRILQDKYFVAKSM